MAGKGNSQSKGLGVGRLPLVLEKPYDDRLVSDK